MPVVPAELDRQVFVWAESGYPVAPVDLDRLRVDLPVRAQAAGPGDLAAGASREHVPFVLVVPAAAHPAAGAMARTEHGGRAGTVNQHARDIDAFTPIEAVAVPDREAYLLVDVERGTEFCGIAPEPAVAALADRGRTPLTVAEGIALLTVRPDVLEKNHCFSLAGSRHGDRRVPAIWISKRAPHLGWCFAGAPHSWLGVASAAERR